MIGFRGLSPFLPHAMFVVSATRADALARWSRLRGVGIT